MNDALRARILAGLDAVGATDGPPGSLRAALAELDATLAAHRAELPADLAHYLERRSYAKARAFLADSAMRHRQ